MQFIKTIQNFANQNNLWEKGSKIIIGVSGGPDSVCLLDVLHKLSQKYNFELHIAHVNYGLRDLDSEKDEKFARKLAEKYGIAISVLKASKKQYKGNLENCLRNIRYDFFEEKRKELNFDFIAVAHNQDDQAETVLMRIIRGSGLNGLSAIKVKSNFVIRPLLQTSREEILTYLKGEGLRYRIDKTNKSLDFNRNVVRHKLLPLLEKQFNPQIKKTISAWSASVADDYNFINLEAERFAKTICNNQYARFNAKEFLSQHPAIGRQTLRVVFLRLSGGLEELSSKQIEEIIKIIRSNKSKIQKAKVAGLNIVKKGDKIDIIRS